MKSRAAATRSRAAGRSPHPACCRRTPSLDLAAGDFEPVKLTLIGNREGPLAGHYIKLIRLAPDLSNFKLHATSIARPQAARPSRTARR